jgi:fructose-1,6-bisphosphatase II
MRAPSKRPALSEELRVESNVGLELVRATEAAALSGGRWMGRGDKEAVRASALRAMTEALAGVHIDGTIAIGDGPEGSALVVGAGERVGDGVPPPRDVALRAVDGTTLVAKGLPNAVSVIATAERGTLLRLPTALYVEKIAVGPEARGSIDVADSIENNLRRVAFAKNVQVSDLTVVMLDRPRHQDRIDQIRQVGARISLISDGEVSGAVMAAMEGTGIDVMMGIGGMSEAVLSACALKCLGGEQQCRLWLPSKEDEARTLAAGIEDFTRVYSVDDLASGDDVAFAATGVTDGEFLKGVIYHHYWAETESIVLRSRTGTVRHIATKHHFALRSADSRDQRKVR